MRRTFSFKYEPNLHDSVYFCLVRLDIYSLVTLVSLSRWLRWLAYLAGYAGLAPYLAGDDPLFMLRRCWPTTGYATLAELALPLVSLPPLVSLSRWFSLVSLPLKIAPPYRR